MVEFDPYIVVFTFGTVSLLPLVLWWCSWVFKVKKSLKFSGSFFRRYSSWLYRYKSAIDGYYYNISYFIYFLFFVARNFQLLLLDKKQFALFNFSLRFCKWYWVHQVLTPKIFGLTNHICFLSTYSKVHVLGNFFVFLDLNGTSSILPWV